MNAASSVHTVTRTIGRDRLLRITGKKVEIALMYPIPHKTERYSETVLHIDATFPKIEEFKTVPEVQVMRFFFFSDRVLLSLYMSDEEVLHAQVREQRHQLLPFKPPHIEAHILFDGIDLGKFLRKQER